MYLGKISCHFAKCSPVNSCSYSRQENCYTAGHNLHDYSCIHLCLKAIQKNIKIDNICICFTRHLHYLFKVYIIHICCLQSFERELCMLNCIVRRDTVKSHFKAPLVSSYKPCDLLKKIFSKYKRSPGYNVMQSNVCIPFVFLYKHQIF